MELLPFVPGPIDFPDHVYQQAFYIWAFEVDRNARATARRLREIRDLENSLVPPDQIRPSPSHDAIAGWAKRDQWARAVVQMLAADKTAGAMYQQQIALMLIGKNHLIEKLFARMRDEAHPMEDRDAIKFLDVINKDLSLAAAQATAMQAPFESARAAITGPRSREDVAAAQLERLRKAKQARKGKH